MELSEIQREVKDSSTEDTALAEPIKPREMNKIRSSFFILIEYKFDSE